MTELSSTKNMPTEIDLQLDLQIAVEKEHDLPTEDQLILWATSALITRTCYEEPELTIRIVDEEESQEINLPTYSPFLSKHRLTCRFLY